MTISPNTLPEGSWDTHVHVTDPEVIPYAKSRSYSPPKASVEELLAKPDPATNIVLVQPSPYGFDNTCLLEGLSALRARGGPQSAFGIAVVDPETVSDDELLHLHSHGVRGLRINNESSAAGRGNEALLEQLRITARRIHSLPGWSLQVFTNGKFWEEHEDDVAALPVPLIADHFGGLKGVTKLQGLGDVPTTNDEEALEQPGMQALLRLHRSGKVWVKVSGLYRASAQIHTHHGDLKPLVHALAANRPDRLIYASDWPHTGEGKDRANRPLDVVEPFRQVNQVSLNRQLRSWLTDEDWHAMLVVNPRILFS